MNFVMIDKLAKTLESQKSQYSFCNFTGTICYFVMVIMLHVFMIVKYRQLFSLIIGSNYLIFMWAFV